MRPLRIDDRHHALMRRVAGECGEPRGVDGVNRDASRIRPGSEVAHSRILPGGVHVNRIRRTPHAGAARDMTA